MEEKMYYDKFLKSHNSLFVFHLKFRVLGFAFHLIGIERVGLTLVVANRERDFGLALLFYRSKSQL